MLPSGRCRPEVIACRGKRHEIGGDQHRRQSARSINLERHESARIKAKQASYVMGERDGDSMSPLCEETSDLEGFIQMVHTMAHFGIRGVQMGAAFRSPARLAALRSPPTTWASYSRPTTAPTLAV